MLGPPPTTRRGSLLQLLGQLASASSSSEVPRWPCTRLPSNARGPAYKPQATLRPNRSLPRSGGLLHRARCQSSLCADRRRLARPALSPDRGTAPAKAGASDKTWRGKKGTRLPPCARVLALSLGALAEFVWRASARSLRLLGRYACWVKINFKRGRVQCGRRRLWCALHKSGNAPPIQPPACARIVPPRRRPDVPARRQSIRRSAPFPLRAFRAS